MPSRVAVVFVAVVCASSLGAQALPLLLRDCTRQQCGWRQAQADRSVLGDGLRIADLQADDGIGTHAPAELVWSVPAGQRWFTAWFGVAHERQRQGSITLSVHVDGVERFASPVRRGGDEPLWIAVSVANARELRLLVGDEIGRAHV